VRGLDAEGRLTRTPCAARGKKSWAYIEKLLDIMFARHDFGAVHLESADLGYCSCPECAALRAWATTPG